jgi:hypothetical protein
MYLAISFNHMTNISAICNELQIYLLKNVKY